ncbi:MAG: DtxR family Mn-dependent transcriptional regulator [Saprospiraceae bacterium]|jgi:DtxR family Mn-dependent transcriptional regulator
MSSAVKENYLKALYFLDQKDSRINITELSNKLSVSKPTASNMVKSLEDYGWVIHQKYKPVTLTDAGRKAAALIIRKHRLTEMFLSKVMGFGWEEVHVVAEQMEHLQSQQLFDRMDEMLDNPQTDPHGSPIPDKEGNVIQRELFCLVDLSTNQQGRLAALKKSSADLLHYLNQCELELGSMIELIKVEPFDGSCFISCDEKAPIMVSQKVAESLLLELV